MFPRLDKILNLIFRNTGNFREIDDDGFTCLDFDHLRDFKQVITGNRVRDIDLDCLFRQTAVAVIDHDGDILCRTGHARIGLDSQRTVMGVVENFDFLHDDVDNRASRIGIGIAATLCSDSTDIGKHIIAAGQKTENGMDVIQPFCGIVRDEKLRIIRIRPTVGHGKHAVSVVTQQVTEFVRKLIF